MPNYYDLDNQPSKGNNDNKRNDARIKRLADSVVEWGFLIGKSTLFGVPIASALDAVLVYGILR